MSNAALKALRAVSLPTAEKAVMLILADMANDLMTCWPSMATIGSRAGMTERNARRVIRRLQQKGYIHCTDSRGKTSNRYTLVLHNPDNVSGLAAAPTRTFATSNPDRMSAEALKKPKREETRFAQTFSDRSPDTAEAPLPTPSEKAAVAEKVAAFKAEMANVHVLPSSVAHIVRKTAEGMRPDHLKAAREQLARQRGQR